MASDENSDPDQGTSTSNFYIITGLDQSRVDALPEYETQVPGDVIGAKIKTLSQINQGKPSFDHHQIFSDYRNNKMPTLGRIGPHRYDLFLLGIVLGGQNSSLGMLFYRDVLRRAVC